MSQKIDYKEYEKRLKSITDTIIPISEYIGWNKPITYKCLVCNHRWDVKEARSAPKGYGCPNCEKKKKLESLNKINRKRLKTEEQFRKELSEKQPNLIPNDIYVGNKIKYHCICKIHKCDVYTTPEKYLCRNQGCKLCAIEKDKHAIRYTHELFLYKLSSVNPDIEVISKYTNIKNRIDVRCKICGHKWNPIAESLVNNMPCGCPKCAGNAIKTSEEFREELAVSHPNLTLLSDYERSNKEVHVQCNKCGRDFWVIPNKLQQGQQCYCCSESHGENKIRLFLENNNIEYVPQKTFDDLFGQSGFRKLSYDFYIPSVNVLIEYQGEQHERPCKFGSNITDEEAIERFKLQKIHDESKELYANDNNYTLLKIWYWDYCNIDSILRDKLLKYS